MEKILILEDEAAILDLCQRTLKTEGLESDPASSIGQAEGLLKGDGGYSLLISDLRLPDGNGIDFIKLFLEACPTARVIVMTEYPKLLAETKMPKQYLSRIEYLMKPFEMADLLKRVRE
jgi:DNA-binding NtrC family response regulator